MKRLLLALALPALAAAQSLPAPVLLDTTGMFQERFARVGTDFYIAGQPTERGLREMKAQGVTVVVNLRSAPEMARVPFDEAALVKSLGMRYVYIPMRGNAESPFTPAALDTFALAVKNANGKVLLHCTVAWRASHLWAAYLIRERHMPETEALDFARSINLMDDMRMGVDGRQPVEQFLNRDLKTVKHP